MSWFGLFCLENFSFISISIDIDMSIKVDNYLTSYPEGNLTSREVIVAQPQIKNLRSFLYASKPQQPRHVKFG